MFQECNIKEVSGNDELSSGGLPNRKYIIGSVFVEWECVEGGRPEVFEISVHFPNMESLTLYLVTKTMQGHPNLLKQNGFVIDPDFPNKYYFVQKGLGCSDAMFFREAIDKMVEYLEGKRNAKGENQNNGVILLFRGYEELAVMVRSLEWAGHHDVLLGKVYGDPSDIGCGMSNGKRLQLKGVCNLGKIIMHSKCDKSESFTICDICCDIDIVGIPYPLFFGNPYSFTLVF